MRSDDDFRQLRSQIEALERLDRHTEARPSDLLKLGVRELEAHLPEQGLRTDALHEVLTPDNMAEDRRGDAAASAFCAVIAGKLSAASGQEGARRPCLWVSNRKLTFSAGPLAPGPYGAGLAYYGLNAGQIIQAESIADQDALWTAEEGLQSGALSSVIVEIGDIDLKASRRLQLAAERYATTCLLLRSSGSAVTAARTRWRLSAMPSAEDRSPSYPAWKCELLRCRGGTPASWFLEWRGCEAGLSLRQRSLEEQAVAAA